MNIALSSSDEGELPDLQKTRHRSDEGGGHPRRLRCTGLSREEYFERMIGMIGGA